MKYESTILKRLIDTYGVVGNPRYISEIIKEFIVRGKERFPNLFTYQSEWLAHIDEFGLNPTYTVSYTGQSIYAPNTLERPVKSAILTGNTLVNLLDMNNLIQQDSTTYVVPITTMKSEITIIATNKTVNKSPRISLYNEDGSWVRNESTSLTNNKIYHKAGSGLYAKELVFTTTNNDDSYSYESLEQFREQGFVVIEGNYEKDVPSYFEGMQSVKMPVLTTSNEDGTKTNILTVNEPVELRGIGEVKDELNSLTGEYVRRIGEVVLDGSLRAEGMYNHVGKTNGFYFPLNTIQLKSTHNEDVPKIVICDKFRVTNNEYQWMNGVWLDEEFLSATLDGRIAIRLLTTKASTTDELHQYLSQNPITVYYQLATESVKTVDLTILDQNGQNVQQLMSFNGGTHFTASSSDGSPQPTVSVSVETDLEETLMMCPLEGYTM